MCGDHLQIRKMHGKKFRDFETFYASLPVYVSY